MKSTAGQRSLHFGYAENAVLSIRHQLSAEASLGQDLATKFPQILEIWGFDKNELKPWEVVPGSAKYAYFVCPKGHHHRSQICEVIKSIAERGRTSCSKCSSKSSASEYTVLFYIQKIFGDEVIHTGKIGPEKIEADIYIPSIKTAIEYDGIFYHSSEKSIHFQNSEFVYCE